MGKRTLFVYCPINACKPDGPTAQQAWPFTVSKNLNEFKGLADLSEPLFSDEWPALIGVLVFIQWLYSGSAFFAR